MRTEPILHSTFIILDNTFAAYAFDDRSEALGDAKNSESGLGGKTLTNEENGTQGKGVKSVLKRFIHTDDGKNSDVDYV